MERNAADATGHIQFRARSGAQRAAGTTIASGPHAVWPPLLCPHYLHSCSQFPRAKSASYIIERLFSGPPTPRGQPHHHTETKTAHRLHESRSSCCTAGERKQLGSMRKIDPGAESVGARCPTPACWPEARPPAAESVGARCPAHQPPSSLVSNHHLPMGILRSTSRTSSVLEPIRVQTPHWPRFSGWVLKAMPPNCTISTCSASSPAAGAASGQPGILNTADTVSKQAASQPTLPTGLRGWPFTNHQPAPAARPPPPSPPPVTAHSLTTRPPTHRPTRPPAHPPARPPAQPTCQD